MSEEASSSGGEFEREPVPDSALLGSGKFWGIYAGEHAAGTEFMIGLDAVKWTALAGTIGWYVSTPIWMSPKLPVDATEVEI